MRKPALPEVLWLWYIHSAQLYLAVFEKLYRFMPFTQDAQERIRGESALQLAGCPVEDLSNAAL